MAFTLFKDTTGFTPPFGEMSGRLRIFLFWLGFIDCMGQAHGDR